MSYSNTFSKSAQHKDFILGLRSNAVHIHAPSQRRGLRGKEQKLSPFSSELRSAQVVNVTVSEGLSSSERLQQENELLRKKIAAMAGVRPSAVMVDIELKDVLIGDFSKDEVLEQPKKTNALPDSYLDAIRAGVAWPSAGEPFWTRAPRSAPSPVALESDADRLIHGAGRDLRNHHVVHITAEMAPIAKVGGLGDAVTGLARSVLARGHHVTVILPFYECLPKDQIEGLTLEREFDVAKGKTWDGVFTMGSLRTAAYTGKVNGIPVVLLRPADWNSCNIFRGGRIYGGSYNEVEAYLYFCNASLNYLKDSGAQPHIIQLHDWHAAAAALLYWESLHHQGLWRPRIVFTVHNLENTGEVRQDEFAASGIPGEVFATVDKALDERTIGHNPERLNLMKGAMVYSNAITTVSPSYAKDMLSGGAAGWLKGLLSRPEVRDKAHGILNGIDVADWDPATDKLLPANFNAQSPEGKAICKEYVQRGLGLEVNPSAPLLVVVSRLVPQKGIHLMRAGLVHTVEAGGQAVLLGSGHSDGVFRNMAAGEMKDHPRCRIMVMYNEALAHLLYAAADMVLVPSMFEPCGLTQLIAIRYGALPVVRRTGGLADTVRDVDDPQHQETGNGYSFSGQDEGSLFSALDRALNLYKTNPVRWQELSLRNMQEDVSWAHSAKDYVNVYNTLALPY